MDKTYYIFRHGETRATRHKRWYWHEYYSATILEEGKPSIMKLAEYLNRVKTDYNVSSPFVRCRQTAELVTQITGKKFTFDSRIREYGLELPWTFKRRLLRFIKDLETSKYNTILICTHAIVIEMLIQYLEHGRINMSERISAPFPGILTVITHNKSQTLNFNQ